MTMLNYLLTKDQHKLISDVLWCSHDEVDDFVKKVELKKLEFKSHDRKEGTKIYKIYSDVFKKDTEAFRTYLTSRVRRFYGLPMFIDKNILVTASSVSEAIERVSASIKAADFVVEILSVYVNECDDHAYLVTARIKLRAFFQADCDKDALEEASEYRELESDHLDKIDETDEFYPSDQNILKSVQYFYSQCDVLSDAA
jgi:hypothetical protein